MLVLVSALVLVIFIPVVPIAVVVQRATSRRVLLGVVGVGLCVLPVMLRHVLQLLLLGSSVVDFFAAATAVAVCAAAAGQSYSGERRYGVTPDEELCSIGVLADHGPDDGVLPLLLLEVAMFMVRWEEDVVDVTDRDLGVRVGV